MQPHVFLLAVPVCECPAALITQIRLHPCVGLRVSDQSAFPAESTATLLAFIALLVVVESRVDQQITCPLISFPTDLALVRTVVHVRDDVRFQTALAHERPIAHETHKRASSMAFQRQRLFDVQMIRHQLGFDHPNQLGGGTHIRNFTARAGLERNARITAAVRQKHDGIYDGISRNRGPIHTTMFLHVRLVYEGPPAVDAGVRTFASMLAEVTYKVPLARELFSALRTPKASRYIKLRHRRRTLVFIHVVRFRKVVSRRRRADSNRRQAHPLSRSCKRVAANSSPGQIIVSEFRGWSAPVAGSYNW